MRFEQSILAGIFISSLIICVAIDYVEGSCESYDRIRENATLEYLKMESDLWRNLSTNTSADKDTLVELVRSSYMDFHDHFGFVSSSDKLFKLPSTKQLKNLLGSLFDMQFNVRRQLESNYFNVNSAVRALDIVSYNAKNLSELITRELSRPEFWTDGTNVIKIDFLLTLRN